MDIIEAIKARKSIRGYKPDPVPQSVVKEILDIAVRSPSSMNTQSWEFTVVTGKVLDELRRANVAKFDAGVAPNPDLPPQSFEGQYRQRQVDLAVQLFQLMGIAREDKEKRNEWMKRGLRSFDAPVAIIISVDRSLGEWRPQFDVGAITQTICLTALKYGLGTCMQNQGIFWPDEVRRITGLPESKRMLICISLGYPDWDFPANRGETEREPVDNITTWCGF